jgi:hypothetical protein
MGLALCTRGTLGKGTLRAYPPFRVPTQTMTRMMIATSEDDDDNNGDGLTGIEVNNDSDGATGNGAMGNDDNNDDDGGMTGNEVYDYGKGMTGDNDDNHDVEIREFTYTN